MPISDSLSNSAGWCRVEGGPVPLRCWWSPAASWPEDDPERNENVTENTRSRVVIVLPEVFGVNAWVRSVADRIAAAGVPALAMPLFARTAPELELGYGPEQLAEGRRHKDATSTDQILADLAAAIAWLQSNLQSNLEIIVVGFCFGGHAALLAASLPQVSQAFDFYGAGVVQGRPGGGAPSLELLPQVPGQLTCLCGSADPLIPAADRAAIASALLAADPSGQRLRYRELEGADHGFMCEARTSFNPAAAEQGWQVLLEALRV
jgi:carboxymethylenebutenolidase